MTRNQPWTTPEYRMVLIADPNPRDPGTASGKSPDRPRPANPVQPRDDGMSRYLISEPTSFATPKNDNNDKDRPKPKQPRDGGHGRRLGRGPQPRDDGSSGVLGMNYASKQSDPQPRDPGNGRRLRREPQPVQPRDPGMAERLIYSRA